jgi:hypothetical protein
MANFYLGINDIKVQEKGVLTPNKNIEIKDLKVFYFDV